MEQANMDLCVLQETKLLDGVYKCGSSGYSIIVRDTPIRHRGGVEVFYLASPRFMVEAIHKFDPKVVRFHLATE